MKKVNKMNLTECRKSRQSLKLLAFQAILTFALFIGLSQANAQDYQDYGNVELLQLLNPYAKVVSRSPSNFVPDDEVDVYPMQDDELWIELAMVEDDAGVLNGIKGQVQKWENDEEYARNWNLESTGMYVFPSSGAKKSYLQRNFLKYFDKRIAGEVKNAEEGSTWAKVGKARKALHPQTAVGNKIVKVKFKARVLQGEGYMFVENPLIEYHTKVTASGGVSMHAQRDISSLGISNNVDYDLREGEWVASVSKQLTQTISARLSSTQNDETMAFTKESDRKIEFMYRKSF